MRAFGQDIGQAITTAAGSTAGRVVLGAGLLLGVAGCVSERFGGPSLQAPRQTAMAAPQDDQVLNDAIDPTDRSGPIESRPLDPPDMSRSDRDVAANESFARPTVRQPTPSSAAGAWRAQDASGASCRLVLTSSPALDLYKASTAGCANRDLAGVNAWRLQDGEVFLYARGGAVVARLRDSGGGFSGALTKSGAPLTLAR